MAARKWLSVCSTSMPSERVRSIYGIANSAKSNRTKLSAIELKCFLIQFECSQPTTIRVVDFLN